MGDGILGTLCLGVLVIGALILLVIVIRRFSRRRDPPAGTYDSPDFDSGGSIGGMRGGRAYDSEDFESGATIGGGPERRTYDAEEIDSGASIGGGPSVGKTPGREPSSARTRAVGDGVSDGWQVDEVGGREEPEETRRKKPVRQQEQQLEDKPKTPYRPKKTGKKIDSPDIESGSSFGG